MVARVLIALIGVIVHNLGYNKAAIQLAWAGADHTECPGGDVELDIWKSVPARMVDGVHADLDCVS